MGRTQQVGALLAIQATSSDGKVQSVEDMYKPKSIVINKDHFMINLRYSRYLYVIRGHESTSSVIDVQFYTQMRLNTSITSTSILRSLAHPFAAPYTPLVPRHCRKH